MKHAIQDIRDASELEVTIRDLRPEFIFHLAAQALVRTSYREPVPTFAINALGTANLLEAVRVTNFPCTVVVVTTDKCYENNGPAYARWHAQFQGEAIRWAVTIPTARARRRRKSWWRRIAIRFFRHGTKVALASARAGNVIGGGDWAEDRIVPDCIRALSVGKPIPVRNPEFTRPWQHVLEPLGGYLLLGARLEEARRKKSAAEIARFAQAFNFGPEPDANRTVRDLVEEVLRHWPGSWEQISQEKHLPEAPLLSLDITKAKETLGWRPRWNFAETIRETVSWYHDYFARAKKADPLSMIDFTQKQISAYIAA